MKNIKLSRIFVDMDGVIVDFDGYMRDLGITSEDIKQQKGAYLAMKPIEGALEAVRSLIGMGFDVWIATKPPTGVAHAYSDKAQWVFEHLPELKRKIIITHDKGLLGGENDYLCDDRPHRANCEAFKGTLLRFENGYHWSEALQYFAHIVKERKQAVAAENINKDTVFKCIHQAKLDLIRDYGWSIPDMNGEYDEFEKIIGRNILLMKSIHKDDILKALEKSANSLIKKGWNIGNVINTDGTYNHDEEFFKVLVNRISVTLFR